MAGIRAQPELPNLAPLPDNTIGIQATLKDLERRKQKWLDLFESDTLDEATLKTRVRALDDEIAKEHARLEKERALQARRATVRATRSRLAQLLDHLEGYYRNANPVQVNNDLHAIIEQIVVTKAHEITIHWRGDE